MLFESNAISYEYQTNEEELHQRAVFESDAISYEQKFYDEIDRKIYFIALKNDKDLKSEKLLSKYGATSSQECFANMVSGNPKEILMN